ncbi:MAG: PAS domain-containing sensor histidine kinase [Myxococcota bacterium]|nr:PAS domain-containing sensor histidine kinase [Myxococcota bacterium]
MAAATTSAPTSDADELRAERERLLEQMRDANERLVLATIRADELTDAANTAREAAADNEERFRSLVTSAAAVVWSADGAGRIRVDRPSWDTFVGIELDEADPRGWLVAVPAEDHDLIDRAWADARARSVPYSCQHRLRKRDGAMGWVVARAAPIMKGGVVREWIGMMTDVSERVRIEEAREQFIAILGHDLRNPLSAIALGAELLVELPEPYARMGGQIARSARRMEIMIRDVMDFTRGRLGGGIPVMLRDCDLAGICREVVSEMTQAYPQRDIQLATEGVVRGQCDSDRMEQVISNLIGNAITHGEDPITVAVRDAGDEIELIVESSGPPISELSMARMFEPYSRGIRLLPKGEIAPGLGLGLYIVSEIVRAHKGTIEVTSGVRTAFTVRYPHHPAAGRRPP